MSTRTRRNRADNSPRQAMRLLMAELSKKKDGPDVIVGWRQLLALLNAATDRQAWLSGMSDSQARARTLMRHIKTVENWMVEAKQLEEFSRESPDEASGDRGGG